MTCSHTCLRPAFFLLGLVFWFGVYGVGEVWAAFLEEYPGAYLAVAPFTLSDSYAGALMRVERSSDGVQGDVMPDASGYISLTSPLINRSDAGAETTLADFAGTDTVYSMVFYDQSGSGNHISSPNIGHARILMVDGELKKDSYGNPGTWLDPLHDGHYLKGYDSRQLHTSVSTGNFTAIVLAEPHMIIPTADYYDPDQVYFTLGGNSYHSNFAVRFFSDGHYRRTHLNLGA